MPRKKQIVRFKYTTRKNGDLYVIFPLPGEKYPVWRICRDETQEGVDNVISAIKAEAAATAEAAAIPDSCELFFNYWLSLDASRVSAVTHNNREAVVRLRLLPSLKNLPLAAVKPAHIQSILFEMAETLAFETVRKTRAVASLIFSEAVNLELIPSNPVSRVKLPKIDRPEKIKTMTLAQAKKFLAECQTSPHGIIFEFALETGLRPEEYLALKWSDIDLEKRTASVQRAVVFDQRGGGFYFKETKTRRSRRTVPFSAILAGKIADHRASQNNTISQIEERLKKRLKPSRENRREYNKRILKNRRELDLVFPSQDFTPIKNHNLSRRYFKPILTKAGLPETFAPYALRHTCATLLLASNVNPKIVSERLGHSSVAITLDTYSHVLPTMQESATDALTNVLY